MKTICGADCGGCQFKSGCKGCEATCGRPFGGPCVAAEYIRANGREKYEAFKGELLGEVNELLALCHAPAAQGLYELPGSFVNMAYPMPSGETVKLLDDRNVYLGTQVRTEDPALCWGAVADPEFLLVCRYGADGAGAELIAYRKR